VCGSERERDKEVGSGVGSWRGREREK
jgi:hypothetical protein